MKLALQALLTAFILIVCGCSDDQDPNIPPADHPKLIKKTVQSLYYEDNTSTKTMEYEYVNGILKSVTENNWLKSEFTYDGQKVTQATVYESGFFSEHVNFVYAGDRLSYTLSDSDNNPEKMEFFYNNENVTGLVRSYLLNNETFVPSNSKHYTFQNGNIVDYSFTWDEVSAEFNSIYTYDQANNYAKNMNPYLRLYLAKNDPEGLSANNISGVVFTNPDHVQTQYTNEIMYEEGFPIDIKQFNEEGVLVMHTVLEYY